MIHTHRIHPNKSPLNILEKRERGHNQVLPNVLKYPLLSQERVKLWTSNLAGTLAGFIRFRTKAHLKFRRKGSLGVSRDCPKFYSTPIISGMGKATDFKFYLYIHRVHPNKSPLKFWRKENVGVGLSRDCRNFLGRPTVPHIISRTG